MENNHSLTLIMQRYSVDKHSNWPRLEPENIRVNPDFIATLVKLFDDHRIVTAGEFSSFHTGIIVDYIRKTHHFYLAKKLPEIEQNIELLINSYNESLPLLLVLKKYFLEYQQHLSAHILNEENYLLPYIEYMLTLNKQEMHIAEYFYRSKEFSIQHFISNHDDTDGDLQKIYSAILEYVPTETNITPYRILLSQLQLLEKDLNMHAFIENHVLLPKALNMENQFIKLFRKKVAMN